MQRAACVLLFFVIINSPIIAQQKAKSKWPPSPHVAATDPLTPAEQKKKIKLPPGFELQLVAADPDIRKPININFDASGRLWVTETIEYPYAAKDGEGRDAVKILEDFGPDGRARKITTFADKLNIPIGVLPDHDAKGALVFSIPSIFHMRDTKGTGKADTRHAYYGDFGRDDTHGMTGEFMQGFDGWIYACHGFRNYSVVKSKNETITMESGNTYRIKPDGSHVEQWTWGQVNPFGLAFDPYGNLYSGDCHSEPLTMLLRHGWYVSFSKPHDGLGFAPHMNTFGKEHSTALCGVAYYAADQYPKEYHGKMFLGDVVTNKINAYRLEWTGSTPRAIYEPFLTSSDPWFRPVDIKLGPDGCLYFADFYNRIIGHYEVALDHPGRDRDKGRIWRIVYTKGDEPRHVTNLIKADVKTLIRALGDVNLTVRLQATHQLVERGGDDAIASLEPIIKNVAKEGDGERKAHALWVLERLGKLDDDMLAQATSASEKIVRVHAYRILTEKSAWTPKYAAMAKIGLEDKDASVQRVAVEALAAHPAHDQVQSILLMRRKIPANDSHLRYATRLALRNQLRLTGSFAAIKRLDLGDTDLGNIADVCMSIRNESSAAFLKKNLDDRIREYAKPDPNPGIVHFIVRHGAEGSAQWALDYAGRHYAKIPGGQGNVLKAVIQATQERGGKLGDKERAASEKIVHTLLTAPAASDKQLGAELAGTLRLASAQKGLFVLVNASTTAEPLRKTCITSLVNIDAKEAVPSLSELLLNEKESIAIREHTASVLVGTNHADAHAALVKAMQNAPARLQTTIALGMAASKQGGDRLLQAIEAGKASPRLLQDRAIEIRLQNAKVANVQDRLKKLTQGLPAADQKAQELITKRRDAFASFKSDVDAGQKLFTKHCANCHQIANQGAKVGPNLDGIGTRGLERLLEDVLDPNRNVDQAFRTTVITTKDGKTVNGLFLREEGKIVILADNLGKDVRIDKANIDERTISPLSPMPSNFAELLSEPEFNHLMAYLLSQRSR